MKGKISIIIPVSNSLREKHFSILYTIKALQVQSYKNVEVVLIADNVTDGTIDALLPSVPTAKVFEVTDQRKMNNVAYLRNLGANFATGDVLLFVDDDTVVSNVDTLRTIAEQITQYDFLCGANRYWASIYWNRHISKRQSIQSTIDTLFSISILPKGIDRTSGFRDLNEYTFIGNFGAIRREAFETIGGFNETFDGWGLEDTELMMRLCDREFNHFLLANYSISVIHLTHPSDWKNNYTDNFRKFNKIEIEMRRYFHVNHFFGIYEGDGYSLFTELD